MGYLFKIVKLFHQNVKMMGLETLTESVILSERHEMKIICLGIYRHHKWPHSVNLGVVWVSTIKSYSIKLSVRLSRPGISSVAITFWCKNKTGGLKLSHVKVLLHMSQDINETLQNTDMKCPYSQISVMWVLLVVCIFFLQRVSCTLQSSYVVILTVQLVYSVTCTFSNSMGVSFTRKQYFQLIHKVLKIT